MSTRRQSPDYTVEEHLRRLWGRLLLVQTAIHQDNPDLMVGTEILVEGSLNEVYAMMDGLPDKVLNLEIAEGDQRVVKVGAR